MSPIKFICYFLVGCGLIGALYLLLELMRDEPLKDLPPVVQAPLTLARCNKVHTNPFVYDCELSDGTRCVTGSSGGFACDWRGSSTN